MSKLITWENIRTKKYRNKRLLDVIMPPRGWFPPAKGGVYVDDYEYEDDLVKFAMENIARANQKRMWTINDHLDKLHCLVYSWPCKNAGGYTQEEMDELLKKFPDINMEKFDKALMGNTCMLVEGETIRYHCDILKALRCGIENRDLHLWEWD